MICYNILTPDNAQETLQRLTGIPIDEWKIIRKNYNNNQVVDDYLDDILKTRDTKNSSPIILKHSLYF